MIRDLNNDEGLRHSIMHVRSSVNSVDRSHCARTSIKSPAGDRSGASH
jgi:hypothetical protein